MTCKYNFKGKEFQSEEELNDFLLDYGITEDMSGDEVFQRTKLTSVLDHYRKVFNKKTEEWKDLKEKGLQIHDVKIEVEPEDLDDIGNLEFPYISVTDLIHTMPGRFTDLAFPIFNSDNYWKEKFDAYKVGNFDNYEVLFIGDLLKKDPAGNYERITDPDILNKIRDRMEGAESGGVRKGGLWKQQAVCGNLVHDIFSRFYRDTVERKDSNGKSIKGPYLYQLEDARLEIITYLKNNLKSEFKPYYDDDILNSIVDLCFLLDKEIRAKYGKNAFVRTELPIIGDLALQLDPAKTATKVIGKIDLLVIGDEDHPGVGIIDYKCSPKNYTTSNVYNDPNYYNSAKILTFKYQLAVYKRILASMGIRTPDPELMVVPLKFEDFKMENGKVSFSRISSLGDLEGGSMLLKLSNSDPGNEQSNINSTLDQVFPAQSTYVKTSLDATNLIKNTKAVMDSWAPVSLKDTTIEGYSKTIEERGGIKYDSNLNKYYYKPDKYSDKGMISVTADSQEEAIVKVIEELKKRDEYNLNYATNTANSIRKSLVTYYKEGGENPIELILHGFSSDSTSSKRNTHYIKSLLEKYTDTEIWKPVPEDSSDNLNLILDLFGLLLFENKQSHLIDIVRISPLYDPAQKVKLPKGEYMLGSFMPDALSHNSADSLTMQCTKGNIELIETMVVINLLNSIFPEGSGIGKVLLVCPSLQTGLNVPNELLLYNFDRLCAQTPKLIKNNFVTSHDSSGNIKMARYVDIVAQDFKELQVKGDEYGLKALDRDVKNSMSKFDWKGKTQEEIKDQLIKLDAQLVQQYKEVTQNIRDRIDDSSPQFKLHKDLLYAIAELSGVKMVQQLEELKKFDPTFKGPNIGLGGTMIDNPGTLQSAILNQATNQVTIAYQNTRDSVLKFDTELRNRVKKLKESKGFGWISLNLTSNQVSELYRNMYDPTSSDIKFVNPWDNNSLTDDEREFLKFAIIKINATRGNGLDLNKMLANPDLMGQLIANDVEGKYLKAPLIKGDFASEVAMRGGIINFIRDRFKYLTVWKKQTREEIKDRINDTVTNLLSTEDERYSLIRKGELWEAINTMSDLDDPKNEERRLYKINLRGKEYFEHNLETLLLKQHSAYVMADELNKVFPVIQSLLIHLNALGAVLNTSFTNDMLYLLDYIKTRIHNQPMEDRTTQEATLRDIANYTMKWASRLALAFNPRQTYQFLDGIWLDIKLFVKLPDGTLAFTKENLTTAWRFVMADLFGSYGDDRSITELLNIKYGINDMDMNTYIDRIKSDNTGLFTHFWDTGFRFSSRPDYYNRMTIFISQALADGSIKIKNGKVTEDSAHQIRNGQLIYDWAKDDRFKAFANDDKSDMKKYNEAKSNYIAVARLLVEEGVKNDDGTLFKLDILHPKPLPKAYSNKESEGRKAFSDRIYGYYAHEKKSMFNSTFVGALTMQMNTYWSAKKNQYIQKRSYTQEGYYTDYIEDGVLYFWKIDETTGELVPTTENTGLPIKVWKGRPLEGIIITIANLARAFKGSYDGLEESGLRGVKELLTNENIDPDLRRLYAANLKLLWYDLIMLLLLGVFGSRLLQNGQKEFASTHSNDKFGNALANTAINLGVGIIDSSADDFNFAKSIFGRGVQWTPFAFSSMLNVITQYKNVIGGSQDFYDALIKTTAATRGTTPFWEFVKLNTIGTKIGEQSA